MTLVEIIVVCSVLALLIYKLKLLTSQGTAVAFLIAVFIWNFRGLEWLTVLVIMFFVSAAATKWKYSHKRRRGTAEARKGKRSVENILGSSYAPLLFLLFGSPVGFLAAVAAAIADNMASELGVFSQKVRLITTLRRVPPGTDGGVSLLGQFASLVGAGIVAASSPLLGITSPSTILIIWISGFLGCQFDSLLGATLERKKLVGKTEVNVAATLFGGTLALLLVLLGLDAWLISYL